MPSMKWIRETLSDYLNCYYQESGRDRLSAALYEQRADIVSEVAFWLETQEKIDKMAKKNNETKRNGK